jgi:hypothetical protein
MAFNLKSGNKSPFKQMGSSPLKQDYVKDIYHEKFNPSGKIGKPKKIGTISDVSKEITRVAKGGKVKADLIKEAAKKSSKKAAKKSFDKWMLGIIKKGGTRAMGTVGAYFGSMKAATATQPGTGKHGGKKTGKYNPKTGKYE